MPDNRINIIIETQRAGKNQVNQVRSELSQLGKAAGKSSKNVQSATGRMAADMSQPARSAKELSQKWQIGMNQAESATKNLNGTTQNFNDSAQEGEDSAGDFSGSLTALAWNFRYLNRVIGQAVQKLYQFLRRVIDTGIELEESYFAMGAAASMYGSTQEEVNEIVEDFADKGLTSLKTTSKAVRDLVSTGMELEKIPDIMERYADVTSLLTSSHDEMENSLRTLTESIIRGTTVLATDTSARLVWGMAQKKARNEMGKNIKELSAQERALLVHKTLKEDLTELENLHRAEMQLTSAALTRATTAWQKLAQTLFDEMAPVLHGIFYIFEKIMGAIEVVVNALGALGPSFLMVFGAVATLVSAFTSLMAVGLVLAKIFGSMNQAIATYTGLTLKAVKATSAFSVAGKMATATLSKMWMALIKIVGPVMIVSAVLSGLTYAILKMTGVFDSHAKKMADVKEQIGGMGDEYNELMDMMEGTGDEASGSGDKIKDYNRRISDLQDDIAREESLGLWRDEEKLADLRKELRRTKEDKEAYQETGEEDVSLFGETKRELEEMQEILKQTNNEMASMEPQDYLDGTYGFLYDINEEMSDFYDWWVDLPDVINVVASAVGALATYTILVLLTGAINAVPWAFFKKTALAALAAIKLKIATLIGVKAAFLGVLGLKAALVAAAAVGFGALVRELSSVADELDRIHEARARAFDQETESMDQLRSTARDAYKAGEITRDEYRKLISDMHDRHQVSREAHKEAIDWGWFGRSMGVFDETMRGVGRALSYSMGGIVPGRPGEPQLIEAHGGEEIIPRWERGNSSPVINFNGDLNVRNDQDIDRIANKVGKVLGRKNRRARIK